MTTSPDLLPLSRKQILSIAGSQARINAWTGAIRSGKTTASLLRWLIYVAHVIDEGTPGELVIVAKTSQTAARNVFAPLQDFALFGELAGQSRYTPGAPSGMILGRRVWVMGTSDERSESRLRGVTCAGAYVDEASLVGRAFFLQLLGRMSVAGAQMFLTSNPDNPNHWLRQDFLLREGELDLAAWYFRLEDNPILTDTYIAAIKAEAGSGLWYRRFIDGEWCSAEGAVFDMFDAGRHVVDICPVITKWLCCAVDYGTSHPFDAVLLGLGTDRRLYVVAEFRWDSALRHRQLTDAEYVIKLGDWLASIQFPGSALHGVTPERMIIDPSALSFKVAMRQARYRVWDADNDVGDGIRTVASLLATDRLKVHRSCKDLIGELGSYAWDESAASRGEDKPVKAQDDAVDALRYAVFTTRQVWRSLIVPPVVPVNLQDTFGVAL